MVPKVLQPFFLFHDEHQQEYGDYQSDKHAPDPDWIFRVRQTVDVHAVNSGEKGEREKGLLILRGLERGYVLLSKRRF